MFSVIAQKLISLFSSVPFPKYCYLLYENKKGLRDLNMLPFVVVYHA